jgi:two-component system response regulator RegA
MQPNPANRDLAPAVAVIDDDEVYRDRLCRAFETRGWEARGIGDTAAACAIVQELGPDLVLVDLRMPEASGLDLIPSLRRIDDSMCIIVLTGYGSIATALEALKRGADHYLSKPADIEQIIGAYERLRRGDPADTPSPAPTVPSLARVEWEHIQRVLSDCGGNISLAAKLLGIHRRSLQRKLWKYPPSR